MTKCFAAVLGALGLIGVASAAQATVMPGALAPAAHEALAGASPIQQAQIAVYAGRGRGRYYAPPRRRFEHRYDRRAYRHYR